MKKRMTLAQLSELCEIDLVGVGVASVVRLLIESYFASGKGPNWTFRMQKMSVEEITHLCRLNREFDDVGDKVRDLNLRQTSGGVVLKTNDPRLAQAKVLWDKGIGTALDFKTFKTYLATIPEIPASLLTDDPDLPLLRLVDPRLGLAKTCKLFGIKFEELGYSDADAVACDTRHETPMVPFWVRVHDGRKNRNLLPVLCYVECKDNLFVMTAMVAIMAWVQDPSIIKNGKHLLDCPGSVPRSDRGFCASLDMWHGEVKLDLHRSTAVAYKFYGSGGFRRE